MFVIFQAQRNHSKAARGSHPFFVAASPAMLGKPGPLPVCPQATKLPGCRVQLQKLSTKQGAVKGARRARRLDHTVILFGSCQMSLERGPEHVTAVRSRMSPPPAPAGQAHSRWPLKGIFKCHLLQGGSQGLTCPGLPAPVNGQWHQLTQGYNLGGADFQRADVQHADS